MLENSGYAMLILRKGSSIVYQFTVLQPSREDYLHWKRGSANFQSVNSCTLGHARVRLGEIYATYLAHKLTVSMDSL